MAVEVEQDGLIVASQLAINISKFKAEDLDKTTVYGVQFQMVFHSENEATRFFNALNASIMVGCVHVHFDRPSEPGQRKH